MNTNTERKMLQKVVSFGSILTNGILMIFITYTLLHLPANLFGSVTDIYALNRASFGSIVIVMIALGALWYGVDSGCHNVLLYLHAEEKAPRATAHSSLVSSIAALAVVGIFAGKAGIDSRLVSIVMIVAAISSLIAGISYSNHQHIAA